MIKKGTFIRSNKATYLVTDLEERGVTARRIMYDRTGVMYYGKTEYIKSSELRSFHEV